MSGPLANRRIALAECRELDLLARMLEREGAESVRCPLVAIRDAPDAARVEAWIRRVIAGECDDLILYTGEGVRRLVGFAERAGLRDDFVAALGRVKKITRGPKPVRALREIGLSPDLAAKVPTTDGIIAALEGKTLHARTVGVQLYGQEPNLKLAAFLEARGAMVDLVAPYIYSSEADDDRVEGLIRELGEGRIAAIAFTSSPQVRRLAEVTGKAGLAETLRQGLARTKITVIGPVAAGELARLGVSPDAMADRPYSMKPFVQAIIGLFAAEARSS
jgi:uroporphyrinogen-III synthase